MKTLLLTLALTLPAAAQTPLPVIPPETTAAPRSKKFLQFSYTLPTQDVL